jgi:hypothetical protein
MLGFARRLSPRAGLMRTSSLRICRMLVTKPRMARWSTLAPNEQAAWQALGWTEKSWDGKQVAPLSSLSHWEELSPAEQAAAQHGLGLSQEEWDDMLHSEDALVMHSNSSGSSTSELQTGNAKGSGLVSTLARAAWSAAKIGAPIVGAALSKSRHPATMVAGHVLSSVPGLAEQLSDPVVVDGIETTLYLDDSGSMTWYSGRRTTPLTQGRNLLWSLSPLLRGPTRIVKFGERPTTIAPRDEEGVVSASLVSGLNWNGDSGGTCKGRAREPRRRPKPSRPKPSRTFSPFLGS